MPINDWAPQLVPLMQWICRKGRGGEICYLTYVDVSEHNTHHVPTTRPTDAARSHRDVRGARGDLGLFQKHTQKSFKDKNIQTIKSTALNSKKVLV